MAWVTPKTNWVDGDYFNINPDYNRIKGNIEYLLALSKTMYADYTAPSLESASMSGYPRVSFFNNVVNATKALLENCSFGCEVHAALCEQWCGLDGERTERYREQPSASLQGIPWSEGRNTETSIHVRREEHWRLSITKMKFPLPGAEPTR